ncbi:MAG: hypothetical protein P8176_08910 [Gammaproteobacteria bacterium]
MAKVCTSYNHLVTQRFLRSYGFLRGDALCVFLVAVFAMAAPTLSQAVMGENRVVGRVFDKTIYEIELRGDTHTGNAVADLRQRIVPPVLIHYRDVYGQLFEPLDFELNAALTHLQELHQRRLTDRAMELSANLVLIETQLAQTDLSEQDVEALNQHRDEVLAELEPPSSERVWSMVSYWKFQQHLYDAYGGGRVVIQPYGPEAVDATLRWLQLRELEGDFSIDDDRLRQAFYDSWFEPDTDTSTVMGNTEEAALELQAEQSRYRLLNPGWMRAWYDEISREGWSDSMSVTTDLFGVH